MDRLWRFRNGLSIVATSRCHCGHQKLPPGAPSFGKTIVRPCQAHYALVRELRGTRPDKRPFQFPLSATTTVFLSSASAILEATVIDVLPSAFLGFFVTLAAEPQSRECTCKHSPGTIYGEWSTLARGTLFVLTGRVVRDVRACRPLYLGFPQIKSIAVSDT